MIWCKRFLESSGCMFRLNIHQAVGSGWYVYAFTSNSGMWLPGVFSQLQLSGQFRKSLKRSRFPEADVISCSMSWNQCLSSYFVPGLQDTTNSLGVYWSTSHWYSLTESHQHSSSCTPGSCYQSPFKNHGRKQEVIFNKHCSLLPTDLSLCGNTFLPLLELHHLSSSKLFISPIISEPNFL